MVIIMDNEKIESASKLASTTHFIQIGPGAINSVKNIFEQAFGNRPAVIVADANTFAVAGYELEQQLRAGGRELVEAIIFPGQPVLYADYYNVVNLQQKLSQSEAIPVVLGSGTLNDITKLAAHMVNRPYMVVVTAASMDGYTAFGAAITKDGFKQTMACPAPSAFVADLNILVEAPARMNSTGYGDLLGKITAGADWLLADALGVEPIEPQAWGLVQDSLRQWVGEPAALHRGEPAAIHNLLEGLVMSGIAMQISQSSRPASGSEHRFSHLWEMQALGHGQPAIPHGFKVGIGTLASAALYEQVIDYDMSKLDVEALCQRWPSKAQVESNIRQSFDIEMLVESSLQESFAKYISAEQLRQRLKLVKAKWPQLRQQLKQQLLSVTQLRSMLEVAGCPTDPAQIGIEAAHLKESYALARHIRSRYTILDLVYETGILDECVNNLFEPDGFWRQAAIGVATKGNRAW